MRGITIPFIAVRQFTRISCFVSEFQSPDVCLYRVLTLPSLIYALDTISSNTSIDSIVYCCILRVVVSPSTFTCSMLYCTPLPSSRSSQCHNQIVYCCLIHRTNRPSSYHSTRLIVTSSDILYKLLITCRE